MRASSYLYHSTLSNHVTSSNQKLPTSSPKKEDIEVRANEGCKLSTASVIFFFAFDRCRCLLLVETSGAEFHDD